jgi:uncharacterized protein YoxC
MVNEAPEGLIKWNGTGNGFIITAVDRFARSVLPLFFTHCSLSSFTRQLNSYGFSKVPHLPIDAGLVYENLQEFVCPNFRKDSPHLLQNMQRKTSKRPVSVPLDRILSDLSHIHNTQMGIKAELTAIQRANQELWLQIYQSEERVRLQQESVNNVVKFIASVFSSLKNIPLNAISLPQKHNLIENKSSTQSEDTNLDTSLDTILDANLNTNTHSSHSSPRSHSSHSSQTHSSRQKQTQHKDDTPLLSGETSPAEDPILFHDDSQACRLPARRPRPDDLASRSIQKQPKKIASDPRFSLPTTNLQVSPKEISQIAPLPHTPLLSCPPQVPQIPQHGQNPPQSRSPLSGSLSPRQHKPPSSLPVSPQPTDLLANLLKYRAQSGFSDSPPRSLPPLLTSPSQANIQSPTTETAENISNKINSLQDDIDALVSSLGLDYENQQRGPDYCPFRVAPS